MRLREWAWVGVAVLCALGWLARPLSSEAVIGALFGAVIGAVVSWYFSEQASNDLRIEAEALRKLHNATLNALPVITDGKYKVTVDEQGHFLKAEYSLPIDDSVGVADNVDPKLRRGDAPPQQE
jgi:prepilin signal peptidase PulO-like enzyme (type II secretory pathway)